jgi:hypothetical protein
VRYEPLPNWADVHALNLKASSFEFKRHYDSMPAYQFGISETVQVYGVNAPSNSNLVGLPAHQLKWVEEKVKGTGHGLPSARYGLVLKMETRWWFMASSVFQMNFAFLGKLGP